MVYVPHRMIVLTIIVMIMALSCWFTGGRGDRGQSTSCGKFRISNWPRISHTKSRVSAKLVPVAKLHRACKALHTTTFLGVSAKVTTQNPGASAKFPAAKFTTANLTWHETPLPLNGFMLVIMLSAQDNVNVRLGYRSLRMEDDTVFAARDVYPCKPY